MKQSKGIAQLAVIIIMLVVAIALPITTSLVQRSQENRSKATETCVSAGGWCDLTGYNTDKGEVISGDFSDCKRINGGIYNPVCRKVLANGEKCSGDSDISCKSGNCKYGICFPDWVNWIQSKNGVSYNDVKENGYCNTFDSQGKEYKTMYGDVTCLPGDDYQVEYMCVQNAAIGDNGWLGSKIIPGEYYGFKPVGWCENGCKLNSTGVFEGCKEAANQKYWYYNAGCKETAETYVSAEVCQANYFRNQPGHLCYTSESECISSNSSTNNWSYCVKGGTTCKTIATADDTIAVDKYADNALAKTWTAGDMGKCNTACANARTFWYFLNSDTSKCIESALYADIDSGTALSQCQTNLGIYRANQTNGTCYTNKALCDTARAGSTGGDAGGASDGDLPKYYCSNAQAKCVQAVGTFEEVDKIVVNGVADNTLGVTWGNSQKAACDSACEVAPARKWSYCDTNKQCVYSFYKGDDTINNVDNLSDNVLDKTWYGYQKDTLCQTACDAHFATQPQQPTTCTGCVTGACGECSTTVSGWRCSCTGGTTGAWTSCKGVSDSTCKVGGTTEKIDAICASDHDKCSLGGPIEVPDTSTAFKWACGGLNYNTVQCEESLTPPTTTCDGKPEGTMECSLQSLKTCKNGAWTTTACPSGYECNNAGYGVVQCVPSSTPGTPDTGTCQNRCMAGLPTSNSGNANCDAVVNIVDFSVWRSEAIDKTAGNKADFDCNGVVNIVDFSIWRNTVFK